MNLGTNPMTTLAKLNEFSHARDPARRLLERLEWAYVSRDSLVAEPGGEREGSSVGERVHRPCTGNGRF